MKPDDIEHVTVQVVRFGLQKVISRYQLRALGSAEIAVRQTGEEFVAEITASVLGERRTHEEVVETEMVPMDWWQAVRDRWLPIWWLKRWPVKMRAISTTLQQEVWHICPHVQVPPGQRQHLQFVLHRDP